MNESEVKQEAERLALKTKDELLAESQRIFGPGIAQAKRVPRWKLWTIGVAAVLVVGLLLRACV